MVLGILEGGKGDIVPNAISMREQWIITFRNELNAEMFEGNDIVTFVGPMVTVLGTLIAK
jgi:hypothetical protein